MNTQKYLMAVIENYLSNGEIVLSYLAKKDVPLAQLYLSLRENGFQLLAKIENNDKKKFIKICKKREVKNLLAEARVQNLKLKMHFTCSEQKHRDII
ncbi:MAG: hypothetical protein KBD78_14500 [Oligoflexales bacterium]|nr:hypothetical protein [Oligoflexales bacterium]